MGFDDLQLSDDARLAVQAAGYITPTPIQEQAIPPVLAGRDVIGSAQTGTGKTAAFTLPMATRFAEPGAFRGLIVEPTRELALQVEASLQVFTKFSPLRVGVMYGGVGYGAQTEKIRAGMDIWVATPGRLLDFIERGDLSLNKIEMLVLDEADRLLDMGFLPDVRRIINQCPKERQTLLFSATIAPEIQSLAKWALKDPLTVQIGRQNAPTDTVEHALFPVAAAQKFELLLALLDRTEYKSVIIFCRTKMGADHVASRLLSAKHKVIALHSDRSQREREEALLGFREGRYEVLVATDIASRGLDISGVTHVINFDVPEHTEDYVHRIGRTGRAHAEGDAFTLFTAEDTPFVASIERFIARVIPKRRLENFKYLYTQLLSLKENDPVAKIRVGGGRGAIGGYSFGVRR